MKICVVGSGGREHALARALARSAPVVVAPGNPGMPGVIDGGYEIQVTAEPPEAIQADLVVIGPEAPLVDGLADRLRADHRRVVGPGADGARLEGSKSFMKNLLAQCGVPTAQYASFGHDEAAEAKSFLSTLSEPYVIKTDGLAAGKGVLVTENYGEAAADIDAKLSGEAFGSAGTRIVIEEGLRGQECSLQVLCDGRRVVPLALAQDSKRVADGDEGPNTGGMGAYSPLPWAKPGLIDSLMEAAVEPLVYGLQQRAIDYRGVLYAGLMLTDEGPKVLEYNVRFGDPEAQVVLPRLVADPVAVLMAVAEGRLTGSIADQVRSSEQAAICVVLATPGYPEAPRTGDVIEGLGPDGQLGERRANVTVIHAGTARSGDDFITAGGRVLGIVATGEGFSATRSTAYDAAASVGWEGVHYRHDIGESAALMATAAPGPPAAGRATVGGEVW